MVGLWLFSRRKKRRPHIRFHIKHGKKVIALVSDQTLTKIEIFGGFENYIHSIVVQSIYEMNLRG